MRFFHALSICALFFSFPLFSEEAISNESADQQEERPMGRRPSVVLSPFSQIGKDPSTEEPKSRAHFAGVRRPPPDGKVKKSTRPKKVKSPWFISKTHPKEERKEELEQEVTSLPQDAPYFVRRQMVAEESSR